MAIRVLAFNGWRWWGRNPWLLIATPCMQEVHRVHIPGKCECVSGTAAADPALVQMRVLCMQYSGAILWLVGETCARAMGHWPMELVQVQLARLPYLQNGRQWRGIVLLVISIIGWYRTPSSPSFRHPTSFVLVSPEISKALIQQTNAPTFPGELPPVHSPFVGGSSPEPPWLSVFLTGSSDSRQTQ